MTQAGSNFADLGIPIFPSQYPIQLIVGRTLQGVQELLSPDFANEQISFPTPLPPPPPSSRPSSHDPDFNPAVIADGVLQCQRAHLKDIGKRQNFGKGSSLTPARDCIDDIRTKGRCIVFNVHHHLAINSNLQTLLTIRSRVQVCWALCQDHLSVLGHFDQSRSDAHMPG